MEIHAEGSGHFERQIKLLLIPVLAVAVITQFEFSLQLAANSTDQEPTEQAVNHSQLASRPDPHLKEKFAFQT